MRATNTTFILTVMTIVVLLLSVAFIFVGSGFDFDYIIPKRLAKLAAIFIGGCCVATAAITFQTLAGNRILAPSIMGYESIYLVFQALLLFFLGTGGIAIVGVVGNFFISMVLIFFYSLAIQYWVIQKFQRDMYQVLLIGFVLTMVLTTLAQFIQLRISPGEFSVFQGLSYASFDRAKPAILLCAAGTLAATAIIAKKCIRELDVVGLGRDQAISLGLNDANYIPKYFALIAILVAVSISLIGPTAFMGIFVANIAYSLAGTSQHRVTLPIGCAVAIIMFIVAQLIVEHLFNYKTTVTILVNILCGGYFLAMTMRARRQL